MNEHTCGGMYDLCCEACADERNQRSNPVEDGGDGAWGAWSMSEPEEWDVVGGL